MVALHELTSVMRLLPVFARAGGGGSGGGGGGGGGGSGGGSGGGILAIGYIPCHYVTGWCNRHFDRLVAIIAGVLTAIVVTTLTAFVSGGLAFFVAIGAIIGIYSGLNDWLGRAVRGIKKSKKDLEVAASKDPVWQEETVKRRISTAFYQYQQDWSNFNVQNMQSYMTPEYYHHAWLMMTALYQMGRANVVANPVISSADVVQVKDAPLDDDDSFTVLIRARANDQLVDTRTKQVIYTDNSEFEELWQFQRKDSQWLLKGIGQSTANALLADPSLQRFAVNNGMFYSMDWGWLLLPQRGQLFGKANFKKSDINNHVIGTWNSQIVQLYTYIPVKGQNGSQNFLIGQITLPKSYGGIIVKRAARGLGEMFRRTPRGYQKISFEWPDFNRRYDVYATDADKVTSFELLNPKFMADLYDKDLPVNIEVVDNTVYFYATAQAKGFMGNDQPYGQMLDVLVAAFKELRM